MPVALKAHVPYWHFLSMFLFSVGERIPLTCKSDCFFIDPKHETKCQDFERSFDRKYAISEANRHPLPG